MTPRRTAITSAARILLVDDETTFRTSTAKLLTRHGLVCDDAADAHAARQLMKDREYAVVIADLRMPGNHELEFAREVSRSEEGPAIILLTAYPSIETAVTSLDLRVASYLVKPVEIDELIERVEAAVVQTQARRTIGRIRERLHQASNDAAEVSELLKTAALGPESEPVHEVLGMTFLRLLSAFVDDKTLLEMRENGGSPGDREVLQALGSNSPRPELPDMTDLTGREREVLRELLNGYRVSTVAARLTISPHTVRNHLKKIFRKLGVNSQVELVGRLKPYLPT